MQERPRNAKPGPARQRGKPGQQEVAYRDAG